MSVFTSAAREAADRTRPEGQGVTQRLAGVLGWVSLGLGVAQVAAPRAVSRFAGVDDSATAPAVVRLVGARELMHAAALLSGRTSPGWVWTRVAGDVVDLSALARAVATRRGGRRSRAALATAAVAGIAAIDVFTAARTLRAGGRAKTVRAERLITVNRPVSEVFAFWRDFANLPRFMTHLERVEIRDDRRSHWVATAPVGHAEWDAEITAEEPDRMIAWRAVQADVANSGEVTFTPAPGGRGTEVRVRLDYRPPGGSAGVVLARVAGEEPDQQVREALRNLKQVLECGEIIAVDEQVSARGPAQKRLTRFARRRLATGGRP